MGIQVLEVLMVLEELKKMEKQNLVEDEHENIVEDVLNYLLLVL